MIAEHRVLKASFCNCPRPANEQCRVEPEPDLHTGSGSNQKVPAPTASGSATLPRTMQIVVFGSDPDPGCDDYK